MEEEGGDKYHLDFSIKLTKSGCCRVFSENSRHFYQEIKSSAQDEQLQGIQENSKKQALSLFFVLLL